MLSCPHQSKFVEFEVSRDTSDGGDVLMVAVVIMGRGARARQRQAAEGGRERKREGERRQDNSRNS